jgi:hypothetical protein
MGLDTSCLIQIGVNVGGTCIKFWAGCIKKEILLVAIYERDRSFRKVGTWGSAPKVKAIVFSFVEISESMSESMVVMFMRAGV